MSYLVDTNILLRNFIPQDPNNEESVKQHEEAKKAVEKLREQNEKLYYSSDTLKEVKEVAQKTTDKNGFGLSKEQTEEIVEKIKDTFQKLPDDKEKIEQLAKELKSELIEKGTPLTETEERDLPHASIMKEYEVENLLTSNAGDFKKYDHFTTWKPSDVILDLQLDKVEKPLELNQVKSRYPDTLNYELNLKSGESANVHIKGLEKSEYEGKETNVNVTQVLYSKNVVEQVEQGEKDVRVEIKNKPQNTESLVYDEFSVSKISDNQVKVTLPNGESTILNKSLEELKETHRYSFQHKEFREYFAKDLFKKESEEQTSNAKDPKSEIINPLSVQIDTTQATNQAIKNTQSH